MDPTSNDSSDTLADVVLDRAPSCSGTYALVLRATRDSMVDVGRLGSMRVATGVYVYVGSAFGPGGLRARLRHHLRPVPRPHWHIDYLRQRATLRVIWFSTDPVRREHLWAGVLARSRGVSSPMTGFGASDCRCPTHLFQGNRVPGVERFARSLRKACPGHQPVQALGIRSRGYG